MNPWRPPVFETPDQLEEAITKYFDKCGEHPIVIDVQGVPTVALDPKGKPLTKFIVPTTAGLAHFLGYASRQSLYDQTRRKNDAPRFSYLIKRALLSIESIHEENLVRGTGGVAVGSIFWLKNHSWTDKPEGKDPGEGEPPMRIHISGKPDEKDLDPTQNDNLEISDGKS